MNKGKIKTSSDKRQLRVVDRIPTQKKRVKEIL
jgi:hypothetical protein